MFGDVDVLTLIEVEPEGQKVAFPHRIRATDKMTIWAIHEEIRRIQSAAGTCGAQPGGPAPQAK